MQDKESTAYLEYKRYCSAILGFVLWTACITVSPLYCVAASPARPNIVFFLIDDMSWSDVSCYGSDYYETPHIDRLAADGVRFTSAYAASTVCSPTRTSLMTGKYPARLRVTHAIPIDGHERQKDSRFRDADYVKNMPLEEVTIAEALKEGGYATGFIGKWHCSWDPPFRPEHQGFDLNLGGDWMGNPGDYFYPYESRWRMTDEHPWRSWRVLDGGEPGEYLTDRIGVEAGQYIERNKDRPFFLMVSHYAVHLPLQAKEALIEKYRAKPADTVRGHSNPVYAAMIESVDDSVGRVMEVLRRLELVDNTIIVFTSDNGGAGSVTSNHPWRGCKGNFYEGGIRVPAIIKWPGVAKAGSVSDEMVITMDYYPTMLDFAGLARNPAQHTDGISLADHLRTGSRLPKRDLFWHFPHYIALNIEGAYPTSTIRSGEWKLIESLEDGSVELFNLASDPEESTNLAFMRADKVKELRASLRAHQIDTQAQSLRPRD